MSHSVYIPKGTANSEFTVKNSRFISLLEPLSEIEEVKPRIKELWKEYPDARHIVYAFTFGRMGDQHGLSDDGEPHGTAGRPVLEVLKGQNLTNSLLIVIRYFGGTKLGTGGLVSAYTKAAKDVLENIPRVLLRDMNSFRLDTDYSSYQGIKDAIEKGEGTIMEEEFATGIRMTFEIPEENTGLVLQTITDVTKGQSEPEEI